MEQFDYGEALRVTEQVKKVTFGKEKAINKIMAAILARGHILMDDIPGVGKTTLAMAFSNAMSFENKRMQFTPDVMPADILGFNMYKRSNESFEYIPGAIMCNLFLGDEINRTSPKTQSALLEVMEENSVTIDGVTRKVPEPFIVIATQNPIGSVGTQMLPESQLDRFMICISLGYPDMEDEISIVKGKNRGVSIEDIGAVISAKDIVKLQNQVDGLFIHDEIYEYICRLARATRENPYIELGISPRGTIALSKMAKAIAFLNQREYVIPSDVDDIFIDVTKHRIILNAKARAAHVRKEDLLVEILNMEKKPVLQRRKGWK